MRDRVWARGVGVVGDMSSLCCGGMPPHNCVGHDCAEDMGVFCVVWREETLCPAQCLQASRDRSSTSDAKASSVFTSHHKWSLHRSEQPTSSALDSGECGPAKPHSLIGQACDIDQHACVLSCCVSIAFVPSSFSSNLPKSSKTDARRLAGTDPWLHPSSASASDA